MSATKVKESPQVKKARKKLKQQISEEHKHFTPKLLEKMSKNIEKWITRHASERVRLKDKSIVMFDENKHPEKFKSQFIAHLIKKIRQGQRLPQSKLRGRVHQ